MLSKGKRLGQIWGMLADCGVYLKSQLDKFASARVPGQESIGWERASSKQAVTFGY